jgi:hypothetical protein
MLISNCCFIQGGNDVNLHDQEATVDLLLQEDEIGYFQMAKQDTSYYQALSSPGT